MSLVMSRGVLAVSLLMALAGCNTGNPVSGLMGQSAPQPAAPAATAAAPVGSDAFVQGFCPQVALRDGTTVHRVYARGKDNDPTQVVYQASIADTTRSCSRTESTLTVNVLAQGRLVSGPQGKAGTINLPVRITVIDGDQQVYSEVEPFSVTIADVNQPTQFIYSRAVTVPGNVSGLTRVHIGFDDGKAKKNK